MGIRIMEPLVIVLLNVRRAQNTGRTAAWMLDFLGLLMVPQASRS